MDDEALPDSRAQLPAGLKHILMLMPRNMRFGPSNATSIDLCVHELVRASRYRAATTVVCQENESVFTDLDTVQFAAGSSTRRIVQFAARLAGEKSSDLIVVQQHFPTAWSLAQRLQTPVLLHTHNFHKNIPRRGAVGSIRRLWRLRGYRSLSGIIFVSQSSLKRFEAEWPEVETPRAVVPNGMDVNAWTPRQEREKEIICVGRAAPEKGIKEAATAVARVLAEHPAWRGRFILSEPEQHPQYFKEIVAELEPMSSRVSVDVAQPWSVVKARSEAAAIAVIPSKWEEPFGRTALEAHAAGCAVVSSGTGGLAEVSGGNAELLPASFTSADIAERVSSLIRNPQKMADLAQMGRAFCVRTYALDEVARRNDNFYGEVYETAMRRAARSKP